jgi:hypothetical protein
MARNLARRKMMLQMSNRIVKTNTTLRLPPFMAAPLAVYSPPNPGSWHQGRTTTQKKDGTTVLKALKG